jgi:hypothetical protein
VVWYVMSGRRNRLPSVMRTFRGKLNDECASNPLLKTGDHHHRLLYHISYYPNHQQVSIRQPWYMTTAIKM